MVLTGGMADGTDFLTEGARLASPIQEYRTGLAFRIPAAGQSARPGTVTSCHSPPWDHTSLPLVWPGPVSAVVVYSGCPS